MRISATLALLASPLPLFAAEAAKPWPQESWRPLYEQAVRHVTTRRLLTGYPDCTMRPHQYATRYEWAVVLGRLALFYDLPCTHLGTLPPDVPWNHWAADSCRVLNSTGLYIGARGGPLLGNRTLLRSEFARTCWSLMRALKGDLPPPAQVNDVFDPRAPSCNALLEAGILLPYEDGNLQLGAPLFRWQLCVGVHRLILWNEQQNGPRLYGPGLYGPAQLVSRHWPRPD